MEDLFKLIVLAIAAFLAYATFKVVSSERTDAIRTICFFMVSAVVALGAFGTGSKIVWTKDGFTVAEVRDILSDEIGNQLAKSLGDGWPPSRNRLVYSGGEGPLPWAYGGGSYPPIAAEGPTTLPPKFSTPWPLGGDESNNTGDTSVQETMEFGTAPTN